MQFLAEYSIYNDAFLPDFLFFGEQWTPRMNFDNTGTFGPDCLTKDELPEGAHDLSQEAFLNSDTVEVWTNLVGDELHAVLNEISTKENA